MSDYNDKRTNDRIYISILDFERYASCQTFGNNLSRPMAKNKLKTVLWNSKSQIMESDTTYYQDKIICSFFSVPMFLVLISLENYI